MKHNYAVQLMLMTLAALPIALATLPAEAQNKRNTTPIIQQPTAKKPAANAAKKEEPAANTMDTAPAATSAKNPYESQLWSAEDVKKFCSRTANGPRTYNNCVERNSERRIGRIKQPLDNNLIE